MDMQLSSHERLSAARGTRPFPLPSNWRASALARLIRQCRVGIEGFRNGGSMSPTYRNGKICYIEIPATDVERSAEFYRRVFGWSVRKRGDGSTAFDDSTGEVSGSWVVGRSPSSVPGIVTYIMVQDVTAAAKLVTDAGGKIILPADSEAQVVFAHFRDPGGNVLGIYQHSDIDNSGS